MRITPLQCDCYKQHEIEATKMTKKKMEQYYKRKIFILTSYTLSYKYKQ